MCGSLQSEPEDPKDYDECNMEQDEERAVNTKQTSVKQEPMQQQQQPPPQQQQQNQQQHQQQQQQQHHHQKKKQLNAVSQESMFHCDGYFTFSRTVKYPSRLEKSGSLDFRLQHNCAM